MGTFLLVHRLAFVVQVLYLLLDFVLLSNKLSQMVHFVKKILNLNNRNDDLNTQIMLNQRLFSFYAQKRLLFALRQLWH